MKLINFNKKLILLFLIQILFSNTLEQQEVIVTKQIQTFTEKSDSINNFYIVSLSYDDEPYKLVMITITPNNKEKTAFLYASNEANETSYSNYDLCSIEKEKNILYVPRSYFEFIENKYFYLNAFCQNGSDYTITFQQIDIIEIEREKRLDFLVFDYEDYLIKFEKSEDVLNSKLMVTAAGGGRGHQGTVNNVKMELFYYNINNDTYKSIYVYGNDIMFNGAGTTFFESANTEEGPGYYLAKVKGPKNTYISFMVRKLRQESLYPVGGKAFYGYIYGDDMDAITITDHGITEETTEDKIIQISIIVKGNLEIRKSDDFTCVNEEGFNTTIVRVKDEFQTILTLTTEEIKNNIVHICIQSAQQTVLENSYILEVQDVTDQKKSTIVTEPLVNGFVYEDKLKSDEVRSYRHSKYIGGGDTKFNAKVTQGIIKPVYIKCTTFPNCVFDKNIVLGNDIEKYEPIGLKNVNDFYTIGVFKNLEKNAYSSLQYLLVILCLSEQGCSYEVSFNDEEDSLVFRENGRITHYVSSTSQNYYHFKVKEEDKPKKVIVKIRSFSGDAKLEIEESVKPQKSYYLENTNIFEFYDIRFLGYYSLKVTSSIGSSYALNYYIIRDGEEELNKTEEISFGMTVVESIDNKGDFKYLSINHDLTYGNENTFVTNIYSVNCLIKAYFYDKEIMRVDNLYQFILKPGDLHYEDSIYKYSIKFNDWTESSTYNEKKCIFYFTSQIISDAHDAVITEGSHINFLLNNDANSMTFAYPYSGLNEDILLKFNLENNYPVKLDLFIDNLQQEPIYFSRSTSYIISQETMVNYCTNGRQVCSIKLKFERDENEKDIHIDFSIKSKGRVPTHLIKDVQMTDLAEKNNIQYFVADIGMKEKGEIKLNFKRGSGIMFAKIVGKKEDPEEDANWHGKVRLPTQDEKQLRIGEYDIYKHTISYDTTNLKIHGVPLCDYGCELYIGVVSTDKISETEGIIDYLEFTISIKPLITLKSSESSERQKIIKEMSINIPSNEYVIGLLDSNYRVDYYTFYVTEDTDLISIEFKSETCILYLNEGDMFPDEDGRWNITSKNVYNILEITNKDIQSETLEGHSFKFAIKTSISDSYLSPTYSFRVRQTKKIMKNIIEITSNLGTLCEVKNSNDYCDFIFPISEYEYYSAYKLFIYAESDIITDLTIYFNKIAYNSFDKLTEEELKHYLPREGNCEESSEKQTNKNYLLLKYSKMISDPRPFALISVRSSNPGTIQVYSDMRNNVLETGISIFGSYLFNQEILDLKINTKNDHPYAFEITCIDGEGKAYFQTEEGDETKVVYISGPSTTYTMPLPYDQDDALIISFENNTDKSLSFLLTKTIHPTVREMQKIKYGFSGEISYSEREFPYLFYTRLDSDESININLKIKKSDSTYEYNLHNNSTEQFEIYGYIIDQEFLLSMMRNKKVNPPLNRMIRGIYDKVAGLGKLYITSDQINQIETELSKYLVICFAQSSVNLEFYQSMTIDLSIMPFNNIMYTYPYSKLITSNLLKNEKSLCNSHQLRAGKNTDYYMRVDYAYVSKKLNYRLYDKNGLSLNVIEKKSEYGKEINIIELSSDNIIVLDVCKNESYKYERESSLNYNFKALSFDEKKFYKYKLKTDKIEFKLVPTENSTNVVLIIPKVISIDSSTEIPSKYYVRLFNKYTYEKDDLKNTISFLNYYSYMTLAYNKDSSNEDFNKTESFESIIENFPSSEPYYITVIAVANENNEEDYYEEEFSYQEIYDPLKVDGNEEEEEKSKGYLIYIIIGICALIVILIVVFVIVYKKLLNKNIELEEQVNKLKSEGLIGNDSNENI